MSRVLLHSSTYISIYDDRENQWLYVDWTGHPRLEDVQAGGEQIYLCKMQTGYDQIVNDNSKVEGLWIAAADWAAAEWFPMMKSKGMRHFAWIMSPYIPSQVSTLATMQADTTGTIAIFYTLAEAETWLRQHRDDA